MSESWPDHSAELARKSMERISLEVDRYQAGELQPARLWLVAEVLSDITQGLIDNETWQAIYGVRQEMDKILEGSK